MADRQPRILLYGTETCPYCTAARMLLTKKGVEFEDVLVSRDPEKRVEMERLTGGQTVPQILIDGKAVGGYDDIYALDQAGRLDEMIGRQTESTDP